MQISGRKIGTNFRDPNSTTSNMRAPFVVYQLAILCGMSGTNFKDLTDETYASAARLHLRKIVSFSYKLG